ncbi:hypothetical protein N665_6073s0002 [Sinapis alba]|nr:hypothetical protein N665_6073s0002 [Sinapis alba]
MRRKHTRTGGDVAELRPPIEKTKDRGVFNVNYKKKGKKRMEMRGIDPRTSRMLSERSTI